MPNTTDAQAYEAGLQAKAAAEREIADRARAYLAGEEGSVAPATRDEFLIYKEVAASQLSPADNSGYMISSRDVNPLPGTAPKAAAPTPTEQAKKSLGMR
ncbi:MAG TPA: hypothetical protein VIF12_08785 [Micavibrio sp.]